MLDDVGPLGDRREARKRLDADLDRAGAMAQAALSGRDARATWGTTPQAIEAERALRRMIGTGA